LAFDAALIYHSNKNFEKATIFYSIAIDCAMADILNIDAKKLAEYYLMRS